ncbi:MAG: hypothetical protein OXG15_06380 [Gammaproteobacteria bacterium]|nr:hypothetical protein [Gammaproteobacteria bacterium]
MTEILRPRLDFERNPKCYQSTQLAREPDQVIAGLLGAHCSGMSKHVPAVDVRAALLAEPTKDCEANEAIRWLLGSLDLVEVKTLFAQAGIPLGRIADHVRWHDMQRPDLIHFLNQFAIPGEMSVHVL